MRRIEKKLNMIKANLLAESRYLGTKGLLTEDISGPQKTDSDIEELADDIFKRTKHLIPDRNAVYDAQKKLINDTAKGNKETRDRLVYMVSALTSRVMSKLKGLSEEEISNRVSRLKINEGEEVSSDDYFSKYNTTMQEQKEICWNMIKHFKSIDKAIAENEKMMNDKIDRAKAAESAGDIEEASDYMESIKLFEFRIQYMNNNRDMLSASENPFFNK